MNTFGVQIPFATGGGNLVSAMTGTPQQQAAQLAQQYNSGFNSAASINEGLAQAQNAGYGQMIAASQGAFDRLARGYGDTYSNLLNNTQGALNSFWNVNNNLQNSTAQTSAGYGNLSNAVLSGINGLGSAQAQAIADQYTNLSGQQAQGLISRGLGNTTIQNSIQRGLGLDQAKAQNDLANQIASTRAGYQSQIGLQGLNFQGQADFANANQQTIAAQYQANRAQQLANQSNIGLGVQQQGALVQNQNTQNQLNWLNSIQAPYPNAQLYSQLITQAGQAGQAALDRQQAQDALKAQIAAGNRMPLPTGGGYGTGGGQGFFGPQANYGSNGATEEPGYSAPVQQPVYGQPGGAAPMGASSGMGVAAANYGDAGAYGGLIGGAAGYGLTAPAAAGAPPEYGALIGGMAGYGGGGYSDLGGGLYMDPAGYVGMEEE